MPEESATPDLRLLVQRVSGLKRSEVEDLMSFFAPDSVWDISRGGLGVVEGREAIRAFFEEWWAAYEDHESEAEEIQDLGNGVAFAVFVQRGRPVGSTGWGRVPRRTCDDLGRRTHRADDCVPGHRRGPRCRRTPRPGTGVGGVGGETWERCLRRTSISLPSGTTSSW